MVKWVAVFVGGLVVAGIVVGIVKSPSALRAWLDTNKIFFEIGAAVALGVMALILSYEGNRIAERQTQLSEQQTTLAERQTQIAESELRPRFRFELRPSAHGDGEVLVAKNTGGEASSFYVRHVSFIKLTTYETSGPQAFSEGKTEEYWVPYHHFYHCEVTGDNRGEIFRLQTEFPSSHWLARGARYEPAPRTAEARAEFQRQLEASLANDGAHRRGGYLNVFHFVEIFYEWALGTDTATFAISGDADASYGALPMQRIPNEHMTFTWNLTFRPSEVDGALATPEALLKAAPLLKEVVHPPPPSWANESDRMAASELDRTRSSGRGGAPPPVR